MGVDFAPMASINSCLRMAAVPLRPISEAIFFNSGNFIDDKAAELGLDVWLNQIPFNTSVTVIFYRTERMSNNHFEKT